MKQAIFILATLLLMCGCNKEDDLSEIFSGRFKITGYRYNGVCENDKLKEMNKNLNLYCITFSGNTFTGILNEGETFNGSWTAIPVSREFRVGMNGAVPTSTELGRMVINILNNASGYSGDHNVMRIYQDKSNYIDLDSGQF